MYKPLTRAGGRPREGQRGASFASIMLAVVLVIFFVTIGIKTLPSYMTYWKVRSAMDSMAQKPDIIKKGPGAVRSSLSNTLFINDVRDIPMKEFEIKKERGAYDLSIDYEVREHLFFNIDVVMQFTHSTRLDVL